MCVYDCVFFSTQKDQGIENLRQMTNLSKTLQIFPHIELNCTCVYVYDLMSRKLLLYL